MIMYINGIRNFIKDNQGICKRKFVVELVKWKIIIRVQLWGGELPVNIEELIYDNYDYLSTIYYSHLHGFLELVFESLWIQ